MKALVPFAILSIGFTLPIYAREWPQAEWPSASPAEVGMDAQKLEQARDYALAGGGSGIITRHGKLIIRWGDPAKLYDLKSTTKSFGAAALGLAIKDGKMRLTDKAKQFHPTLGTPPETNAQSGWIDQITILHLASQTAGFEKPGGYTPLLFPPGTKWDYSDSGPNWLAECITLAYKRDLNDWMFERLFTPIGIKPTDLVWRKNSFRPHTINGILRREFGSGISANVDAMARFGYLFLRRGEWNGQQILPGEFIDKVRVPTPEFRDLTVLKPDDYSDAAHHYGLLWWNNNDEEITGLPNDAYWSWGLYDSLIVVIPSLDIVVARAGQSWKREKGAAHYAVLKPFLQPIAQSAQTSRRGEGLNPSSVIQQVIWSPTETIVRKAQGSDNWPITWADDDALYTAYGDGYGFEPRLAEKLSLGFAKIGGSPPSFNATNLRAPSLEQNGEGAHGKKASGLLMVEGVLYMWVRNANNSQLAWSDDHGRTWRWSEWRWTNSFGCPTFLNFGPNYENARDNFVYVYSPDADSAYTLGDRMILGRVPKRRITDQSAYEFFQGFNNDSALWTRSLANRGGVLASAGNCYRSGITYNAGLRRYLWCQTLPDSAANPKRYGLAIYDAVEPWGPWTLAFYAQRWDVDAGESCSFPTKWMSANGKEVHLVFAGNDSFSVRKATLVIGPDSVVTP